MRSSLYGKLTLSILIGAIWICSMPWIAAAAEKPAARFTDTEIRVEGEPAAWQAMMRDGRTYVPASQLAPLFGARVTWDGEYDEITIHTALGDAVVIGNEVPVVRYNDSRYVMEALPYLHDGRLYAPLRQLAAILHATIAIDADTGAIELAAAATETVSADNSVKAIAAKYRTEERLLRQWNGIEPDAEIDDGVKLKVVIPSFADAPAASYTEEELMLLARITMVEAGYESYEGQLALANVILNRVNDSRFPDTIKDVIYAGKQFPPAHNGLLDAAKPHKTALRAAKDALNGKNNVEGALYFYNPDITRGSFWSGLDVVATIGHHRFAK